MVFFTPFFVFQMIQMKCYICRETKQDESMNMNIWCKSEKDLTRMHTVVNKQGS